MNRNVSRAADRLVGVAHPGLDGVGAPAGE